jgi:hypothetical protein
MINPNILLNFMMWYVSEKENNISKQMRKALNLTFWLQEKRGMDLTLAISISSNKHNVEKQELYLNYRKRQSFIAASKKLFTKSRQLSKLPEKLCGCGCGKILINSKNKFINGHIVNLRTKEYKQELAKKMREAKISKKQSIKINNVSLSSLSSL